MADNSDAYLNRMPSSDERENRIDELERELSQAKADLAKVREENELIAAKIGASNRAWLIEKARAEALELALKEQERVIRAEVWEEAASYLLEKIKDSIHGEYDQFVLRRTREDLYTAFCLRAKALRALPREVCIAYTEVPDLRAENATLRASLDEEREKIKQLETIVRSLVSTHEIVNPPMGSGAKFTSECFCPGCLYLYGEDRPSPQATPKPECGCQLKPFLHKPTAECIPPRPQATTGKECECGAKFRPDIMSETCVFCGAPKPEGRGEV